MSEPTIPLYTRTNSWVVVVANSPHHVTAKQRLQLRFGNEASARQHLRKALNPGGAAPYGTKVWLWGPARSATAPRPLLEAPGGRLPPSAYPRDDV